LKRQSSLAPAAVVPEIRGRKKRIETDRLATQNACVIQGAALQSGLSKQSA
jgi:hypothetical protein